MTKTLKCPRDPSQLAKFIVDVASGQVSEIPIAERRPSKNAHQAKSKTISRLASAKKG